MGLLDIKFDDFADSFSLPEGKAKNISLDLQKAILLHRLSPGTKLSEDEVGEVYGVSRSIARVALQALAHSELITIEKNRGAFVAKPSVEEARNIFDARARIEPMVAALAAENITDACIDRLIAHTKDEHLALDQGDMGHALYLSGLFHVMIAEIGGQPVLTSIVKSLIARSSLIIALYWIRKEATCETNSHEALLRALKNRDAKEAEGIMKSHIIDLFSGLNLRDQEEKPKKLSDILKES